MRFLSSKVCLQRVLSFEGVFPTKLFGCVDIQLSDCRFYIGNDILNCYEVSYYREMFSVPSVIMVKVACQRWCLRDLLQQQLITQLQKCFTHYITQDYTGKLQGSTKNETTSRKKRKVYTQVCTQQELKAIHFHLPRTMSGE